MTTEQKISNQHVIEQLESQFKIAAELLLGKELNVWCSFAEHGLQMNDVLWVVSNELDFWNPNDILSISKISDIVDARYITLYLIKQYVQHTDNDKIAKFFGRDKTWVCHSLHKIKELLDVHDAHITDKLQRCENALLHKNIEDDKYKNDLHKA